ncbi:c-type cytochrome [Marivirga harenae]|uniref:c-type cytochrome n=1 Tax=Marivirga harenae TaxID=2010992 RepID=UPI0026E05C49|nr:c-type cytochrome [Marivirga harenae]WKV12287.1 c-type cytochrome [Marivirga harenae]|tara:strand:+ start:16425 stop:17459 length:1035 start_codon:yes stop_codon:yes gene_type:complete
MDFLRLLRITTAALTGIVAIVFLLFLGVLVLDDVPNWLGSTLSNEQKEWSIPNIETDLPDGKKGKKVKFGYLLATESPKWMGPQVIDKDKRLYAGNNLTCQNCHLEAGTKPGAGSWVGVTNRFPQFRGRENKIGSIEERINGCMERSMDGKSLPDDSEQMEALVAYMEWLSVGVPEDTVDWYKGFVSIKIPAVKADTIFGKQVYINECQVCHGENGQGTKLADERKGYQYPPLWGDDSFNHGAGMHRVLTAAQFIKANMPHLIATKENPKLTDEQAYHVAAYINSFSRPKKPKTEEDFPDLKLKPVSTAYGPWDDPFPAEQHQFGPFQPIIQYYDSVYQIKKTK